MESPTSETWQEYQSEAPPLKENRLLQVLLAYTILFFIVMGVNPSHRMEWLAEHVTTVAVFYLILKFQRQLHLSNLSYLLITLFFTLHIYGAHYGYAATPAGAWLQELFHTQRNHYDRIVHFAFGLLFAYPCYEALTRALGLQGLTARCIACALILAAGAFYELVECWASCALVPGRGLDAVGAQGDIWDTQHDMALALYGSILTLSYPGWRRLLGGR